MAPRVEGASRGFRYNYHGVELFYGYGSFAGLVPLLDERGLTRVMVVTGAHVGRNEAAMNPVRKALGDRLVAVFDGTEPAKGVDSSLAGVELLNSSRADVIVAIGSGSSLDTGRLMALLQANTIPIEELVARRDGVLVRIPDTGRQLTPIVVVPTTFAGADLSDIAVAELSTSLKPSGHQGIMRIWGTAQPISAVYDPQLFASTPLPILLGSCPNGFSKGLETLWSRRGNGITDATAGRGLKLMRNAIPRLATEDPDAMAAAVEGLILVQFDRQLSVMHAVGHAFSRRYPLQQGFIHGVAAPHVMRFVLERADGRRDLLAEALLAPEQMMDRENVAGHICAVLEELREILGFPRGLAQELTDVDVDFKALAAAVTTDALSPLSDGPQGFEPAVDELVDLMSCIWYGH